MNLSCVISLVGGIALFLFGMSLMGEGLKKVAGNKLEIILYRLSNTPLKGMLLGAGVTAVIQSSSATSVMVVGFVNSGMMKLRQAVSVILGAVVGTSATGWIICLSGIGGSGWASLLSSSTIASAAAIAGIILRMFCKKAGRKHTGDIFLGFAVLMFGMQAMSAAVSPLKDSREFVGILTSFSNPLLGILAGTVFSAILQSSSAAVGILQALSVTGAVTFATAYPLILGIAIGSSFPVLLSAFGARVDGRRSAWAYLIIETIGAALFSAGFYALDYFMDFSIKSAVMDAVSIALLNTVFRAANSALLLPFITPLTDLLAGLIRESDEERHANEEFDRLDERFLVHPSVALEQSRMTVNSMARLCRGNFADALSLLSDFDAKAFERVDRTEELIDRFEDKIGTYLVKLNACELNEEQNAKITKYLHSISDFERISDHAKNISEAALEIYEKKISFAAEARREMQMLESAVTEILQLAVSGFIDEDIDRAYLVEPLEERIDALCDEVKLRHAARVQNEICSLSDGFVYNDLLTNYERVADHCSNIAIAMIELQSNELDAHGYIINLMETRPHNFNEIYAGFCEKYKI